MKLYDLTLKLLTDHKILRNSDKKLIWSVWYKLGFITNDALSKDAFLNPKCPTPEAITRCRREIQEQHKELQADAPVEKARQKKAQEKGTHIYREEVVTPPKQGYWTYEDNKAIWVEK